MYYLCKIKKRNFIYYTLSTELFESIKDISSF